MRYAVMSGGKRIRPLLVYATGECLGIAPERLDVPATAIEFITPNQRNCMNSIGNHHPGC